MGLPNNHGLPVVFKRQHGAKNLITDVKGVRVGHSTINDGDIHTGVTAVLPHGGNLFKDKVMAAVSVINGFGKSTGLIQIEELGTIETPIMLTNTLSAGTVSDALTRVMLEQNQDIGTQTGTVNCVVTECNDGALNDIRGMHVKEKHVREAIANASENFAEGGRGRRHGNDLSRLKRRHRISIADTENRRAAIYDRGFGHVQLWCGRQSCDRRPPL